MPLNISDGIYNAMLQEVADQIDAGNPLPGKIQIYDGTQPETAGGAVTDQVLLAELTCSLPCGAVSSRTLTFAAVTEEDNAPATGIAAWARILDGSDTVIGDLDVGNRESGAALKLDQTQIYAGGVVTMTSCTITI